MHKVAGKTFRTTIITMTLLLTAAVIILIFIQGIRSTDHSSFVKALRVGVPVWFLLLSVVLIRYLEIERVDRKRSEEDLSRSNQLLEDAVIKSERRYQMLAEISPVGIFHSDTEGRTTYVNPCWSEISGLPARLALGNGWLSAVHPDDRDRVADSWKSTLNNAGRSLSEYRFLRPDGSISWVIGQALPAYDQDGAIIRYVGTITDITTRKNIEAAVLLEKNLSDSIINSLPGLFYLYDKKGRFIRWNKNLEQVTMYSSGEIRRMHPLDYFPVDEQPLVGSRIEEVFTHGQTTVEAHLLLKNTHKIPYYFTGKEIRYEGQPCLMGVGIDISERVAVQEQLKATTAQLRELAAHLEDIREEERAAMAREIHDELGQQLTGLKMDIYWVKEELKITDTAVLEQVNAILDLIDQTIQTVRKISAALRPPILDDLGLEEAVLSYSREFQQRYGIEVRGVADLRGKQVSPKISIGLYRIFQESLTNVARHADASAVRFSLSLDGKNIALRVGDNGKGFDARGATPKKTLGLLGMRERTYMLDGNYRISSRPGAGTEVQVTVPMESVSE